MDEDTRISLNDYIRLLDRFLNEEENDNIVIRNQISTMSNRIYHRIVLGRLDEAEEELGTDTLDNIDNIIYQEEGAFEKRKITMVRNKMQKYLNNRHVVAGIKNMKDKQKQKSRKKGGKKGGKKVGKKVGKKGGKSLMSLRDY